METTYNSNQPYEGKELNAVLAAMNTRQLRNVLKSAYRKEARKVKDIVAGKAASSGLRHGAYVGRSVRVRVFSRGGGFMVTTKSLNGGKGSQGSTAKGFHKNRYGQWKPIALWANSGTVERNTNAIRKHRIMIGGSGKHGVFRTLGPYRGRMRAYGFMDAAEKPSVAMVEQDMGVEIQAAVLRRLDKGGIVTSG